MNWVVLSACAGGPAYKTAARPTQTRLSQLTSSLGFRLLPMESIAEQVTFTGDRSVQLAGQWDYPLQGEKFDLIFIIHHADPITRENYQFLAAKLIPLGFAVFRFDKRGTGESGGVYGCCEAEDALAAYRAAVRTHPEKFEKVFIVAQSIGTQHLAGMFSAYAEIRPPDGVILLSSLLSVDEVLQISAPILIVLSDQEQDRIVESQAAVLAHQDRYPCGASLEVAENTEHTLFDISHGMIDWDDPDWTLKFSADAWLSIREWLESHRSR